MVHLGRLRGIAITSDTSLARNASAQRLRPADWMKSGDEPDSATLQHLTALQRQLVNKAFQTNAFEAKLKARDSEEERSTTANEVLEQALRNHAASVASLYVDSSTSAGPHYMQRLPRRSLGRFQYEDSGPFGIEDSRASSVDWDEERPQSQRRQIHARTTSGYLEAAGRLATPSSSPGTSPRSRASRPNRLGRFVPTRSYSMGKSTSGSLAAPLPPVVCIGRQGSGNTTDSGDAGDAAAAEASSSSSSSLSSLPYSSAAPAAAAGAAAAVIAFQRSSSSGLRRADQLLMALRGSASMVAPSSPGSQAPVPTPGPQAPHHRLLYPVPSRLHSPFRSSPNSPDVHRRQGVIGGGAALAGYLPRPSAAAATVSDPSGTRNYLQITICAAAKRHDRTPSPERPAGIGLTHGSAPRLAPAPPPHPRRSSGGTKVMAQQAAQAAGTAGEGGPGASSAAAASAVPATAAPTATIATTTAAVQGEVEELVLAASSPRFPAIRHSDTSAAVTTVVASTTAVAAATAGHHKQEDGPAPSGGADDATGEGANEARPCSQRAATGVSSDGTAAAASWPKPPLPPRTVSWCRTDADVGALTKAAAGHAVMPAEALFTRVSRSAVRNARQQEWVSTYEPPPPQQQRPGPSVFLTASCGASPYATLAATVPEAAMAAVSAGGSRLVRHSTTSIPITQDAVRKAVESGERLPPLLDGCSVGGDGSAGGGKNAVRRGRVVASLSCSAAGGAMIATQIMERHTGRTALPATVMAAPADGSLGPGVHRGMSPDGGSGAGPGAPEAGRISPYAPLALNAAAKDVGTTGGGGGGDHYSTVKGRRVRDADRWRGASVSEDGNGGGLLSVGGGVRNVAVQHWAEWTSRGGGGAEVGGSGPSGGSDSPSVVSRVRCALGQLLTRGGPSP